MGVALGNKKEMKKNWGILTTANVMVALLTAGLVTSTYSLLSWFHKYGTTDMMHFSEFW